MAVKQTGRKTYKTMQGKAVDMDLLRKRNELEIAVGNAKVNARGDELGAGGKIVKKREDVLADYYRDNPSKVPVVEKGVAPFEDAEAPVEPKAEESKEEWVEDAEGNFVKKGE